MPVRCAITKVTGQGEQITVDVCQWNPVTGSIVHKDVSEMAKLLDDMLRFTDLRLEDMNTRMLEAYEMDKYFAPGEWQKVLSILDVLSGRQTAAQVVQRWESIREENDDLAKHRAEQQQIRDLDNAAFHAADNGSIDMTDVQVSRE